MYDVKFYKDKNGNRPVLQYLRELASKSDKDSRIKLQKIQDYIKYLRREGKGAGEPYIKLGKPSGSYPILKKWDWTMNNSVQYNTELRQAKTNLSDLQERGTAAIGESWDDIEKELFTPEETAATNLRVAMMVELVNARKERGISQKKLEELSGVKQPIIVRMEKGYTSPQIDTVLKVLAPLNLTLAVVPIE